MQLAFALSVGFILFLPLSFFSSCSVYMLRQETVVCWAPSIFPAEWVLQCSDRRPFKSVYGLTSLICFVGLVFSTFMDRLFPASLDRISVEPNLGTIFLILFSISTSSILLFLLASTRHFGRKSASFSSSCFWVLLAILICEEHMMACIDRNLVLPDTSAAS